MAAQLIQFLKEAQKFFFSYQLDTDFRDLCNSWIDGKKPIKIYGQPPRMVSFYLAVIASFSEKYKDYYKEVFQTKKERLSDQVSEFLKKCFEDRLEFRNFRLAKVLSLPPSKLARLESVSNAPGTTPESQSILQTTEQDKQAAAYDLWNIVHQHGEELKTAVGREALLKNPAAKITPEEIKTILDHELVIGADLPPQYSAAFLNPDGTIDQKKWDQAVYKAASQMLEKKSTQTSLEQYVTPKTVPALSQSVKTNIGQPRLPQKETYIKHLAERITQHRLDLASQQTRQRLVDEGIFTEDEIKVITSTGLTRDFKEKTDQQKIIEATAQKILKGRGEIFFKKGPVQISSSYNPQKPYNFKTIETSQGIHHLAIDPQTSKIVLRMPMIAGESQAAAVALPMINPIFKASPTYPQSRSTASSDNTPMTLPNLPKIRGLAVPSFVKDFSTKGQILGRRLILKYATPMRVASLFSAGIGGIIGGSLFGNPTGVLGGAISGAMAPRIITSGVGGSVIKGTGGTGLKLAGRAALASNPVGLIALAVSSTPQLAKIVMYAVLTAFLLPPLLFFLKDNLLKPEALLNPTAQKTEANEVIPVPGGNTCDITGFDLFNGNAVTDDILDRFINQSLATGLVRPGTDQERLFQQRARFIRDQAQSAGLNPAIFLGYWKSESAFSDYTNPNVRPGMDLGCDPKNRSITTFEEDVLCAVGKSSISNSRTSQCAVSRDKNSPACQALLFQEQRGEISLPVDTLKEFLDSYGSKIDDPNNARSDAIVKKVILDLGLGTCQGGGIPPGPALPNFVYYCQGNTAWATTCTLGQAGCGPTTLAMVLSSFGIPNSTPPEVDRIFNNNRWRVCGNYPTANMPGILSSSWLSGLGFDIGPNLVNNNVLNVTMAKDYLDQGYLIVGSSKAYPCANCRSALTVDHIFVVDAVDLTTNPAMVDIRDPNNCSYADGDDENPAKRVKKVSDFPWYYAFPIKKVR